MVRSRSQRKKFVEEDDDEDEDEEKESRDEEGKTDEQTTSARERRFHQFASVEYDGEIVSRRFPFVSSRFSAQTPVDFLESVIAERPRRECFPE